MRSLSSLQRHRAVRRTGTATGANRLQRFWQRRTRYQRIGALTALVVAVAVISAVEVRRHAVEGLSSVRSIAVLPLVNMSGDTSQEYFADGLTEELITDLARLTGLKRVIARGSVMRYKGTKKPLSEIARELKVDALILAACCAPAAACASRRN